MIPRRYVIAGLGIGLAIVLAVDPPPEPLRRRKPSGRAGGERLNRRERRARSGIRGRGRARSKRAAAVRKKPRKRPRSRRSASRRSPRPGPSGDFGRKIAATTAPATGWVGSKVLSSTFDDWEPAVADRPEGAVHLPPHHPLRRRGTAATHCPTPWIPLDDLEDGGATWSPQVPLCAVLTGRRRSTTRPSRSCPNTGAVYAAFLNFDRHNGFSTVFTKSTDHGADMDRAGARLRQRLLDGQARDHLERRPGSTSTSPGTGRRAATSTSASRTTSARRGRRRSSPTTSATTTPTTPASSATGRSSSRSRASSTPV